MESCARPALLASMLVVVGAAFLAAVSSVRAERWSAWALVFVALVAILVFIGHSAKLERHEHRWAHEVETEIRHWADE